MLSPRFGFKHLTTSMSRRTSAFFRRQSHTIMEGIAWTSHSRSYSGGIENLTPRGGGHEVDQWASYRPMLNKISVVIPAFNEEDCVDELARRLTLIAADLGQRYQFEFLIVENGSRDRTFEKLLLIHRTDPRFKILRLSRNFGIEGAITAGLRHINGDAAVIMCADLQDPPELIPALIEQWESGYKNVYTVVRNRSDEGPARRLFTKIFYWLVNRLHDSPVPANASDFRLVDRSLYLTLNQFNEKTRLLRTIWTWIGGPSTGVPFDRAPRHGGKSTYGFGRNISFALRGIMSGSTTPLKIIPFFGTTLSVFSFVLLLGFIARWIITGVPFNGFGTILAVILLLFGLLFLLLGMLAEYVGLIFEEVRNRPLYVASELYGLTPDSKQNEALTRPREPADPA
jgi:dolichol-phosphate mannosyltransferase